MKAVFRGSFAVSPRRSGRVLVQKLPKRHRLAAVGGKNSGARHGNTRRVEDITQSVNVRTCCHGERQEAKPASYGKAHGQISPKHIGRHRRAPSKKGVRTGISVYHPTRRIRRTLLPGRLWRLFNDNLVPDSAAKLLFLKQKPEQELRKTNKINNTTIFHGGGGKCVLK